MQHFEASNDIAHSIVRRRDVLKLAGASVAGLLGLAVAACTSSPVGTTTGVAGATPAANPAAGGSPAPAGQAAPSQGSATTAAWSDLVAAGQKEGKVVVSGPPAPGARDKLPAAFKKAFNIDIDYLGGNSSQLASRVQTERAAGQYTMDVSLGGADTVYGTFLGNKWIEPLKPALILPDVLDPKVWPTGGPWFRDPEQTYVMQIFDTIQPLLTINTSLVSPDELKTTQDLLNPKWKGKIASYDPSVNGGGLIAGSVLYTTRGPDYAKQLFQGQMVATTRDYQQGADWVAHGNYPIGLVVSHPFLVPFGGSFPLKEMNLIDAKIAVSGGFGLVTLWNKAPHPNAARVFVNWIASKEGLSVYAPIDGSAPVRTDIDASAWLPPELIPRPGSDHFDVYEYQFVMVERSKVRDFFTSIKG